jgi:hypothetical protein
LKKALSYRGGRLISLTLCLAKTTRLTVIRYPGYISQLEAVVKPGHLPAIKKLRALAPRDIVKPEHYFNSEAGAVGVVLKPHDIC